MCRPFLDLSFSEKRNSCIERKLLHKTLNHVTSYGGELTASFRTVEFIPHSIFIVINWISTSRLEDNHRVTRYFNDNLCSALVFSFFDLTSFKVAHRVVKMSKKVLFLFQDRHHSPSFQVQFHNHPLKIVVTHSSVCLVQPFFRVHCMDQSKSQRCSPCVGLI